MENTLFAIELLQITHDSRETTFLFQRLSVVLQRGNAVSFRKTAKYASQTYSVSQPPPPPAVF